MTRGDYALGCVLFAVPPAAATALAAAVLRRWTEPSRLVRVVAGLLLGVAAYLGIHLVPLAFGVLSRASVVVVALAVAAAAALLWRRGAVARAPARGERPATTRAQWGLAIAAGLPLVVATLADMRRVVARLPIGVDVETFHLPNVARWIQSGSLWQIDQFLPLQAQGYYPNTGDLLHLGALLPWHNDFAYRVPGWVLLGFLLVALFATARELGASDGNAALFAVLPLGMPAVVDTTIVGGLPDVLLMFAFACALLFGVRHHRGGDVRDLLLAGVALGLVLGTKWYGVPAAAVLVLAGALARLRASGWVPALREATMVSGVIAAVGGIWLLRNAIEAGNPLFPVRVEVAGVTLLDAPVDVVRREVGFSIAHYLGDLDVLLGKLPGEYVEGLGRLPLVLALGIVLALALARRLGAPVVSGLGLVAVVLFLIYCVTPYTALGFEGDPVEANFNARYSLPALLVGLVVSAWAATRLGVAGLALGALAALVALGSLRATFPDLTGRGVAVALAGVVAAGAALVVARRLPRAALPVAAGIALLAVVVYGDRTERRINQFRYAGVGDPAIEALAQVTAGTPAGDRVAIAGDWNARGLSPVWPAFGPRMENEVEVVGRDAGGFLTNFEDLDGFRADLERRDPDVLVVGRGLTPEEGEPAREERFAEALGWTELARSERLVLYLPPRA